MIEFLKAKLVEKSINGIVVEKDNIGFFLFFNELEKTELKINEYYKFYTRLIVREDDMSLYGFFDIKTRDIFDLLITINGIGPRVANAMLSEMSSDSIIAAIREEDANTLVKAPGIGKKTAGRIVLELKDKVKDFGYVQVADKQNQTNDPALDALVALGYSISEAQAVLSKIDKNLSVEEIIKNALKMMG